MREGWVGVHKCGGLIQAIPNNTTESYKCSVRNCSNRLSDNEYYIFRAEELPSGVNPVAVKSMSRSDRKKVAEADSKDEAIDVIQRFIREGRVNLF